VIVAPGFEPVAELLRQGTTVTVGDREVVASLGRGGGAFAAYVDGACVLDVCAGEGWSDNTRAVVMSATKGLSTMCAHLLHHRGLLDIDAPVSQYWPEFGSAGKDPTTVRQMLSHQSGAIGVPGSDELLGWDGRGWSDTEAIAAAIATAEPAWEPGTRHGYHGVTYGWLVGAVVQRVSGRSLGTYFADEIAGPTGADCAIGTATVDLPRVAPVIERSNSRLTIDPTTLAGRSVLAGRNGSLFADADGAPRFAAFLNQPAVLAAEIGSVGATATARGLARLYSALVQGELVSPEALACFAAEQVCGRDKVMRTPTRWAVGYTREAPPIIAGMPRQHGPNDEAFGHMGAGGQVAFADPTTGVSCAFVRNHLEHQAMPVMGAVLVAAFYDCLNRLR
jgi:CubicO group peptidase (beta-lactamase class C family)